MVAVVAALELDDLVPPGESAGEADGRHGGLGSRVAHAHLLHAVHGFRDQSGHLHFQRIGDPEAGAEGGAFPDRVDNDIGCVSQDCRAPGADVVDVLVSIHIPDVRPLGAVHKERTSTHGAEGADG